MAVFVVARTRKAAVTIQQYAELLSPNRQIGSGLGCETMESLLFFNHTALVPITACCMTTVLQTAVGGCSECVICQGVKSVSS